MVNKYLNKYCKSALLLLLVLSYPLQARASENIENYGVLTDFPARITEYSKESSTATIEHVFPPEEINICDPATAPPGTPPYECRNIVTGAPTVNISCAGGTTDNGGWIVSDLSGNCFESVQVCYFPDTPDEECIALSSMPITVPDVLFTRKSYCNTGESSPSQTTTFKEIEAAVSSGYSDIEFCMHDDNGTPITGAVFGIPDPSDPAQSAFRADDMFKILTDTHTFFEYLNAASLVYIDRNAGGGFDGSPVMMPSGPLPHPDSKSTKPPYWDYESFINNPSPLANMTVTHACYPVDIELCTGINFLPPLAGRCGPANSATPGTYMTAADIPDSAFCRGGVTPVNLTDTSTEIAWNCPGFNGGDNSPQCDVIKSQNGMCGSANGGSFDNLAELQAANLCAAGTATTPSGSGSVWTWTCAATGPSGSPATCGATKNLTCTNLAMNDNMVFVQDLSGSFGDDIMPTTAALTSLFNNTLFNDWQVGLTSFKDHPVHPYGSPGDYTYRDESGGLMTISTQRSSIISEVQSYTASGGNDWPESQMIALSRALDDYLPRLPAGEGMTLVLVTDATAHMTTENSIYPPWPQIANRINSNNLYLIVLAADVAYGGTSTVPFYQGLIDSNLGSDRGTVVQITSSSTNLADALLEGLFTVICE